MIPSIGRIVLVNIAASVDDKPQLRPAVVTAVWSDICINVRLFSDGGNDTALLARIGVSEAHPEWLTSITQALAGDGSVGPRQWCWPPRV